MYYEFVMGDVCNYELLIHNYELLSMDYISLGKTKLLVSKTAFGAECFDCREIEAFEGEAELKYLRDNIYIGGYGMRSERKREISQRILSYTDFRNETAQEHLGILHPFFPF